MPDEPDSYPVSTTDNAQGRVRYGGCTCGAVRFEVHGDPLKVGTCHCLSCRKATGAAFLFYADWDVASFRFSGNIRTHDGRSFCPNCGSRLFHLSPTSAEIMLGALDESPSDLKPTREGWIIRRETWIAAVAGSGQFERDPPKNA